MVTTGATLDDDHGWVMSTIAHDAGTGAVTWTRTYTAENGYASPVAIASSPNGKTVYVTGVSDFGFDWSAGIPWLDPTPQGFGVLPSDGGDYLTIAYDVASGDQLWTARYDGPTDGIDSPSALSVASDGTQIYVTGTSDSRSTDAEGTVTHNWDIATVAYDAANGSQVWSSRFDDPWPHEDPDSGRPMAGFDGAVGVQASPDGKRVFVVGLTAGRSVQCPWLPALNPFNNILTENIDPRVGDYNYTTLAYAADTGARLWTQELTGFKGDMKDSCYDSGPYSFDEPLSLAVSPDGESVFVTGASRRPDNGEVGKGPGECETCVPRSPYDYLTVAYDGTSGGERWVRRFHPNWLGTNIAYSVGVSPDGTTVYVTGVSGPPDDTRAATGSAGVYWTTLAYGAQKGKQRWKSWYGAANNVSSDWRLAPATHLTVDPKTGVVYVVGDRLGQMYGSGDALGESQVLVAYAPNDGSQKWDATYDQILGDASPASTSANQDGTASVWPTGIALAADGSRVFVTGTLSKCGTFYEYGGPLTPVYCAYRSPMTSDEFDFLTTAYDP